MQIIDSIHKQNYTHKRLTTPPRFEDTLNKLKKELCTTTTCNFDETPKQS